MLTGFRQVPVLAAVLSTAAVASAAPLTPFAAARPPAATGPGMVTRLSAATRASGTARLLALTRPLDATARQAVLRPAAQPFPASAGRQVVRDLRAAWQITHGRHVTVAVISDGVDGNVTGLKGKVTQGPRFGAGKGSSSKVNGTVFASAVAGTGPSSANAFGTLGLAPAARILSIRVPIRSRTANWQDNDAKAIRYAVAHGAKVIYVDEVGYSDTKALASAVQYAVARNAIVVADEYRPKGGGNGPQYPDSLPGVMGTGSAELRGLPMPPSLPRNIAVPANESILVTSPGNSLTVTGPGGQQYIVFKSLAAAAWLTATVTLLKSVYPSLPADAVVRALASSARDAPRGGYNTKIGFGLINPVGALHAAAKLRTLRSSAPPGPGVVAPTARILSGPAPGPVNAVPRSAMAVDGSAAVAGAGVLLLLCAAVLPLVWRRRSRRRDEVAG